MDTTPINRLLTAAEVAAMLNVKVQTLALWRCTGKGPAYVKFGNKVGYAPESISTFTAAHTRNCTVGASPAIA